MDRAEKLAMEQYPVPKDNIFANSVRNAQRAAFRLGYLTAEKDLALTWEDMKRILVLTRKSIADTLPHAPSDEELAKEVLKRFNEQRKK